MQRFIMSRFHCTSVHNTFTVKVQQGNEIRRTGEASDSFVAFASLHKELLLFLTSRSLSALSQGARRSGQNVTRDQAILPCCFGGEGKSTFPKKKTPDRRLLKTRNFTPFRRTITRMPFVKVMTFSITLRLVGNLRHTIVFAKQSWLPFSRSLTNQLCVIFNPLLFVFFIRPWLIMVVCRVTIAFLLRQNYKKGESHLMKTEIWYAARREEETWTLNESLPPVRQSFRYNRI